MRLLHIKTHEFAEFNDDAQRPRYVIASHRWGADEAKYKDVEQGCIKQSAGFKKIEAFANYVNENVKDVE
jgi:hypothetical protein